MEEPEEAGTVLFEMPIDIENIKIEPQDPASPQTHLEQPVTDEDTLENLPGCYCTLSVDVSVQTGVDKTDIPTQTNLTSVFINQYLTQISKQAMPIDEIYMNADKNRAFYYTGLPNFAIITNIFNIVSKNMTFNIISKLKLFQQFLVVLFRLRLGLEFQDLAYRFNVTPEMIAEIWHKWIDEMCAKLDYLIKWPTNQELLEDRPNYFKSTFRNKTAVIIDCFETYEEKRILIIGKDSNQTRYKHTTSKYLIVWSPQGQIIHVTDAWMATATDKDITEQCGVLEKLDEEAIVLTDFSLFPKYFTNRGFHCGEVRRENEGNRLFPWEVEITQDTENVRLHFLNVIGSVKNEFKILKTILSHDYGTVEIDPDICTMDKIVRVCCALLNYCNQVEREKVRQD